MTDNPINKKAIAYTEETLRSGKESPPYEVEVKHRDGHPILLEVNERPYFENGKLAGIIGVARDATERKRSEAERERLVSELQNALVRVRTLSGLIPICASCKKIRDDGGFWNQVEKYVTEHSNATFSHGLCPDCARKLYPDYFDE